MGAAAGVGALSTLPVIGAVICSLFCFTTKHHGIHGIEDHHGHHGHSIHRHRDNQQDYDADTPPHHYQTIVRVYVGSPDGHRETAAGVPGIVLFDNNGQRLGEFESKTGTLMPGGFRDFVIPVPPPPPSSGRRPKPPEPAYLHLVAGKDDICIAALALVLPDGRQEAFSGNDLRFCDKKTRLSSSNTVVEGMKPDCFWLEGHKDSRTSMGGLSVHLPDFISTNKRQMAAYVENPDLACAHSPRLYSYYARQPRTVKDSIHIFHPPLEYDKDTGLDKDASRILQWASRRGEHRLRHKSDSIMTYSAGLAITNGTSNNKTATVGDETAANEEKIESSDAVSLAMYPPINDEQRIRTAPPSLWVSDRDFSAQASCARADWNQGDILSFSEKLYCDMRTRQVMPICDNADPTPAPTCFNHATWALQSSDRLDLLPHNTWTPTGDLVGYQYTNITYLD